jgi:predicted transcriptional regulator
MTVPEKGGRVKISLDVSPELYNTLNNIAQKMGGNSADVLLNAIALMEVAVEAKQQGKHLWIADENKNLESEIVGI